MLLRKGGVAFEVTHPSDIARLKRAGYEEVKPEEFAAEQQAEAEKATGTGSKTTEPEETVAPEETPKKGKGKK